MMYLGGSDDHTQTKQTMELYTFKPVVVIKINKLNFYIHPRALVLLPKRSNCK